jgi:aldose 1-epimerase
MLTDHTYFNLDAFANPATDRIWNHTLHMPYAHRNLQADAGAVPTGKILYPAKGTIDDFWSATHQLGTASGNPEWIDHCGGGCNGYNGEFLFDDVVPKGAVVAQLASAWSGIKAELRTNQAGLVIYTCNWMDGSAPIKTSTQGLEGRPAVVNRDGCVAIEAQDWVDGINQ